ncbi:MAG: tRNA (adenosine(37)-N6)-threonylcarbamoyltransferase complex transferase subunit TsaD [Treponema sp.]|nr:tRNA (adenosine(37)-N6)-threonylcarbamoyltransferase complex transferase subunit TsaD [Treponema sp.]
MRVLGIETSCDECAAAVVENGEIILSNIVMTQIPFHAPWSGVVPEIASRKHIEWIYAVAKEAIEKAGLSVESINAVAVTSSPGLLGSLLVGLTFAKAFAWARNIPYIAVDHMLAHLYAPRLMTDLSNSQFPVPIQKSGYPFLGLLVSGGHTIICKADNFDDITVLGTTIDDAVGEAFDKVAKYYSFGYPGGTVIDKMANYGNSEAFHFPMPSLHKGDHRYDVSYSGLKNAVINQLDLFKKKKNPHTNEDIAASFQKTAVDILLRALFNAAEDTGLTTIVAGGGVAANSYLRSRLSRQTHLHCIFPPIELCGDNGAMIAGIGYQYLARGETSPLNLTASAKVSGFKKKYP